MEFPFMTLRSLQFTTLLALISTPVLLLAQAEISSKEEERLEALAREDAEWYAPKNSLTVGFRVLGSGGKVQFGKLGSVPYNTSVAVPLAGDGVNRVYNNGFVNADFPRLNETDSAGNQTSTQGGRYQVISNSIVTGDYLSYTPGLSRNWSYTSANQALVQPGYIAMSSYSTTSDGDVMNKKQGVSAGVELQFNHIMGKLSKRIEWSLVAGVTLNGINDRTAGDVHSTLNTTTDYYYLNGQAAPAIPSTGPYSGPSYGDLVVDGVTTTSGLETTVPVSSVPVTVPGADTVTAVKGAATVHGKWQVKGAYFMLRVGPSVHSQLTERLGVSASMGVAGAYAGTHYTADESFEVPDVGTTISTSAFSDTTKFVTGYYADLNLDWAANERSGLFGGLSAQKLGDYSQALGSRTARVDLGSSVGLRGGINIKF